MARTFYMLDGSTEVLFDEDGYKDFQKIIAERLGGDAESFVAEMIKLIEEEAVTVASDLANYEAELESQRDDFQELLELTKELDFAIDAIHISRTALRATCIGMRGIIIKHI